MMIAKKVEISHKVCASSDEDDHQSLSSSKSDEQVPQQPAESQEIHPIVVRKQKKAPAAQPPAKQQLPHSYQSNKKHYTYYNNPKPSYYNEKSKYKQPKHKQIVFVKKDFTKEENTYIHKKSNASDVKPDPIIETKVEPKIENNAITLKNLDNKIEMKKEVASVLANPIVVKNELNVNAKPFIPPFSKPNVNAKPFIPPYSGQLTNAAVEYNSSLPMYSSASQMMGYNSMIPSMNMQGTQVIVTEGNKAFIANITPIAQIQF